uniref:Aminotransferase-like plant mobile domain-containing protein n=1 Tax=Vitis vinifera TaxID=29760 RepID=A5AJ35_VITVI|nr:hypothetical protein VITISV_005122 [Vitis vinifera]
MSKVFNSVLKGARSLPITALVQLTFFLLNSYFVVRREQCANQLASNEEYTPYVDAKIKANVVKAGSHEIVLYDHIRGQFHVKTNKSTKSSSTRGRTYHINLPEYACTCDWGLITSLVERWRPETHTFHLPVGEMTITLHDVVVILGLRIHRLPITGTCDIDWSLLCYELLGVTPPTFEIRGSEISTRWLCHQFSHLLVDLDDTALERYARAFILGLIGSALFTDKKGTHIHMCYLPLLRDLTQTSMYSWGSAVLAHLYRELCRASLDGAIDIAGSSLAAQYLEHDAADDLPAEQLDHELQDEALLHEGLPVDPLRCRWRVPLSWAQNPSRVLTFYRDQLDAQTHDQVLWEPYMGDLVVHLPAISLVDQEIWRTMSPLICFDIVEWHRPKRLLR